jgi:uncharacterized membrane protein YeaQ/YmgE (transglycosylase-associated protein family)
MANQSGCLRHPIWGVMGATASVLALLFAIFVWVVPNYQMFTSNNAPEPVSTVTTSQAPATTSTNSMGNAVQDRNEVALNTLQDTWLIWFIIGCIPAIIVIAASFAVDANIHFFPTLLLGNIGAFGTAYLLTFFLISPPLWVIIIAALVVCFVLAGRAGNKIT